MDRNSLYQKFNFTPDEILKGEEMLASYSDELRKKFLSDIYGDYKPGNGFYSVYSLYGQYPPYKKVILCNLATEGTEEEKVKLAWGLSHPVNQPNESIEDFFPLIFDWICNADHAKIFYWLSMGLLFYLDKPEARIFINQNIHTKVELANALQDWLIYQPRWFRHKFKSEEIELWQQLKDYWPQIASDEFKAREINKALGLNVNLDEVWYHEIDNPWNYSTELIHELSASGIQINLIYNSEIAMGGPVISQLILNNKKTTVAGPFVTDDKKIFLCCKLYNYDRGNHNFRLVLIHLKSGDITDLGYSGYNAIPYKFVDDEFIILIGGYLRKVDFEKDAFKVALPVQT